MSGRARRAPVKPNTPKYSRSALFSASTKWADAAMTLSCRSRPFGQIAHCAIPCTPWLANVESKHPASKLTMPGRAKTGVVASRCLKLGSDCPAQSVDKTLLEGPIVLAQRMAHAASGDKMAGLFLPGSWRDRRLSRGSGSWLPDDSFRGLAAVRDSLHAGQSSDCAGGRARHRRRALPRPGRHRVG